MPSIFGVTVDGATLAVPSDHGTTLTGMGVPSGEVIAECLDVAAKAAQLLADEWDGDAEELFDGAQAELREDWTEGISCVGALLLDGDPEAIDSLYALCR